MYYSEDEARELVIKAGLKLIELGLIARTWGNISARISDKEFIITPSGMAYESLTPEKLVKVNAEDLSYDGDIKPSSEKGIHAIAYVLRPELNFIIHTHQFYASVIGVANHDTENAVFAEYALPGTDKLKEKIMKAIAANPSKNAFLMSKHGALCLGKDYDDAFRIAEELEFECKKIFESVVSEKDFIAAAAKKYRRLPAFIDDYAQIIGEANLTKPVNEICTGDDKEAQIMILEKNCAAALYARAKGTKALGFADAKLQRLVYLKKYSKLKDKA